MPCHVLAHRRRPTRAADVIQLLALAVLVVIRCHQAAGATAVPVARAHTWSFFNIQSFMFVGNWNNQTYQAQVCLRNICHNSTTNIVRMMVFVHDAPYIMTSPEQVHSITPAKFLDDGTMPGIWFQSIDGAESVSASVLTSYDQLIELQEDATAMVLSTELPANVPFTLRMEGSERVHQLPIRCTPRQHQLFPDGSVWLGIANGGTVTPAPADHTRLAFQAPPPNTRGRSAKGQTAGSLSISQDLVDELAALLGMALPAGTDSTGVDSNQGSPAFNSTSNSDHMGTAAGEQQQSQQRKLLMKAPSPIRTMLASSGTEVKDDQQASSSSSSTQVAQHQGVQYPSKRGVDISSSVTDASLAAQAGRNAETAASGIANDAPERAVAAPATGTTAEERETVRSPQDAPELRSGIATSAPEPQEMPVPGTSSSSSISPGFTFGLRAAAAASQGSSGVSSHRVQSHEHRTAAVMKFNRRGATLRFLALQHLAHHRALGFSGSIMVVTPHSAEQLMQSRQLRRAMQRQRLVLIVWDQGLEPRATHFMQVPAYNLLRLAAWGSDTALGFWDLDEYLVLPGHESVSDAVFEGCMSPTLAAEPEAVLPSMWVSSRSWNSSAELAGWMQHGYWSKAVQSMDYVMWPYTFCDGACKSIIHPQSDLLFQVHQHARPPPRQPVEPVSWRCGYMLHFYQLWSQRTPELMAVMGYEAAGLAGIPLFMDDILSKASIEHLARLAKVYADLIGNNPELAL